MLHRMKETFSREISKYQDYKEDPKKLLKKRNKSLQISKYGFYKAVEHG